MKAVDLFYLSWQNFKNRKSRIFLTILGVSIGIGAILFLVSLGYGLQRALLERITTADSLLTLDITPAERRLVILDERTIERVALIENVNRVSPQAIFSSQVSMEEITSEAVVNLVNPDFFLLEGLVPTIGRTFTDQDQHKIVVNSSMAELFNLQPDQILEKSLNFSLFLSKEAGGAPQIEIFDTEKEFKVVGVIQEAPGTPSQAFLKRGDLPELTIEEYQFAKVRVADDQFMEEVREELIGMGFLVSALSDIVAQANQIFRIIQIVLGIFGVVALIVAAIGLVNTMTISLLERTNEVGIMRSIGASPSDIQKLFLRESFIIGFLGGIAGIGIGILGGEAFNFGINIMAGALEGEPVELFVYPLWFIIFVIILSSLVGLIAGYWPARRAAHLNPLAALRYK